MVSASASAHRMRPFSPRFSSSPRRLHFKGFNGLLRCNMCGIGFFVATLCLYSVANLNFEKNLGNDALYNDLELPKVTIFSAPRPVVSSNGSDLTHARQKLAVSSWLALSGKVDVVLFGRHPSIVKLKEEFHSRVTIEPAIDYSFLGTPFFHSMVARAQVTASDISVLTDPETVLLPEILNALTSVQKLSQDWFLFAFAQNINLSHTLSGSGLDWFRQDGRMIDPHKLQDALFKQSEERSCGERLFMAWNNPKLPLFHGVMPPFLYGEGFHDSWLINEILSSETRTVFDASNLCLSFYPENSGILSSKFSEDRTTESEGPATFYWSLYFHKSFHNNRPYETVRSLVRYYFLNEQKVRILSQESEGKKEHVDLPGRHNDNDKCSLKRFDNLTMGMPARNEYNYTLERLLETVADENKSVVLGVSGGSYRDMVMSWVCRLRFLGVTNFLLYALDPEMHEFSISQGLPVFMDTDSPRNISGVDDCHFGTDCFKRVTKFKSRMVLKILKLGYNVLFSDVDIYWFQNPLPFLSSFGPGILMVQSDEYKEEVPMNSPRRINSGFYFARSDPITTAAIELVVEHASSSKQSDKSEQPSFYDVLCGARGDQRVGDDQCVEPRTNLTVIFLDRDQFPNGGYKKIWKKKQDVRSMCASLGCFVLHNNWISGKDKKLERQKASGLWDYDPNSRLCVHDWSN